MAATMGMPGADTLPKADMTPPTQANNAAGQGATSALVSNTVSGVNTSPIDSAQARLVASRARLRVALIPPDPYATPDGAHGAQRKAHRLGARWRAWRRSMHGWPLVDVALHSAQTWWQRQPLRPVGELLATELRASALPLVRKHPLITVVAAGALGVLLVAGRPWRWPVVAKQVHRAPHRLGNWLVRQLGNASVQASLIGMLMLWARQPPAEAGTADGPDTAETSPRPSAQG